MDGSEWIKYLPMAFNGDKYAFVGEARTEDPLYGLEATPVYYRKDKYELLDSGTFWLNESGIKGELGWDAAYPRICTYCLLRHRNTEEIFLFMNTHLDNKGREAREKGFELIIAKAKELGADRYPLIITGDMNTAENDEKGLYEKLLSFGDIGDVRHIAAETEGGVTFRSSKSGYPIDYIFVSKKNTRPMKYSILREAFEGKYVSDHFGIYAEIRLTDTAE